MNDAALIVSGVRPYRDHWRFSTGNATTLVCRPDSVTSRTLPEILVALVVIVTTTPLMSPDDVSIVRVVTSWPLATMRATIVPGDKNGRNTYSPAPRPATENCCVAGVPKPGGGVGNSRASPAAGWSRTAGNRPGGPSQTISPLTVTVGRNVTL